MKDKLTAEELREAAAMRAAQLLVNALKVLRPLEITMRDRGWPADECALMWRVIASAALENAREQDAAP